MNRGTVLALLLGLAGALPLMVAFATPGGALFVLLVPLPLFLSGLSMGTGAAAISGAAASAALGLTVAMDSAEASSSVETGLRDALVISTATIVTLAAPVVVLVRQALLSRRTADGGVEWYPSGLLVTWLTGVGIGLLAFSAFSVLSFGEGKGIRAAFAARLSEAMSLAMPDMPQEKLAEAAQSIAPIGLGVGVDIWLLLLAVNGILALGVLRRYGRNLRPAPDIATLELPGWLALALAGAALLALLGEGDLAFLAGSLVFVLLLPFFFAGLAVVHAAMRLHRARATMLVIFYLILVFFTWPAAFVTGIGLFDQWIGFRRRFLSAGGEQEEE